MPAVKCPHCRQNLILAVSKTNGNNGASHGDRIIKAQIILIKPDGAITLKCGNCKKMVRLGGMLMVGGGGRAD